jgi:mono/diheme cytochrome c family protein
MARRWIVLLVAFHVVLVTGVAGYLFVRPRLPSAERGRRLAEANGCFGCHGPEGLRGSANPGRTDQTVPTWEGDLMMFAHDPGDIREWIRDGVTHSRSQSESWRQDRDRGVLKMPAFKNRLSESQINDLVAFVSAVHGIPEPEDSTVTHGRERIAALGCIGCHGSGGRLARRNPRSLKGYVPSWDGADFPELVQGKSEFREWVERGVSRRFDKNPMARFFLDRAVLKMPAFERHLEPGDIDAIWAYIEWLRSPKAQHESMEHTHGD